MAIGKARGAPRSKEQSRDFTRSPWSAEHAVRNGVVKQMIPSTPGLEVAVKCQRPAPRWAKGPTWNTEKRVGLKDISPLMAGGLGITKTL